MKSQISTLLSILIVMAGCNLYPQDEYQEYVVVEAYLIANNPLPQVRLTTSGPLEESYSYQEQTVRGAHVEIRRLNNDSSVAETYQYLETTPGFYNPILNQRVRAEASYHLYISTEEGQVIEATTYVPGTFNIQEIPRTAYHYQQEQQIEITTSTSRYPGRQSYYIFSAEALNPEWESLTPFYRNLVEDQDDDLSSITLNSSDIINEANFKKNTDGSITLPVPWLSIAFLGENDIIINAIDDNMYDFLRSQSAQTGVSTLAPGEIQNITYNIEGGIGIFGAMASDTMRVNILPQKEAAP